MTLPHSNLAWFTLGVLLTTLAMARPTPAPKIYATTAGYRFTINAAGARVWLDRQPPNKLDAPMPISQ